MKKVIVPLLITSLMILGACEQQTTAGSVEPVQFKHPLNVEQARNEAAATRTQPTREVAPARVETPTTTSEAPTQAALEATETQLSTKDTTSELENSTTEPEIVDETIVSVEETVEEQPIYEDIETGEPMPVPADEFEYYDQTCLGMYTVTFYTREEVGYDAPGASGLGLVPGYTCAMPDASLLGATVLIENYGFFLVTDISPDGVADIFLESNAEIPAHGIDYQNVYLVG